MTPAVTDQPGNDRSGLQQGVQLPLGVQLRDAMTLEAFEPGPNAAALHWLRAVLSRMSAPTGAVSDADAGAGSAAGSGPAARAERGWFWGGAASGRSHLLAGACHAAMASGLRSIHLPAAAIRPAPAAVLDGLEQCRLVVLDDVDALAGDHACEAALFDLCNRLHAADAVLLTSASATPLACGWRLSDLASRFAAAAVFRLRPLDDDARARALRRRARLRGIDLDARTASYILARFERDPHALFALLDDLDEASLTAQRRVTIPFVRSLLAARGSP